MRDLNRMPDRQIVLVGYGPDHDGQLGNGLEPGGYRSIQNHMGARHGYEWQPGTASIFSDPTVWFLKPDNNSPQLMPYPE
jgi:hypothetical protein